MRRPAFRLVVAFIPPKLVSRIGLRASRIDTNAVGPGVYLSALDVYHARVFGRCESLNGIAPYDRLVEQVMARPPYVDARRVFWIVDNCSVHRGQAAVERLRLRYPRHPRVQLVHAPTHASWLNQVEIYFSIVQRKVLTPNDFADLNVLAERLLDFQYYWESAAQPFDWKFTRQDLKNLLAKFDSANDCRTAAA
jgi:hypothetical protein